MTNWSLNKKSRIKKRESDESSSQINAPIGKLNAYKLSGEHNDEIDVFVLRGLWYFKPRLFSAKHGNEYNKRLSSFSKVIATYGKNVRIYEESFKKIYDRESVDRKIDQRKHEIIASFVRGGTIPIRCGHCPKQLGNRNE